MRFIPALIVFCTITVSAIAQTDTSYQLLWYKGKQLKVNVLLTPRFDTVRYDPVGKTVHVAAKKTSTDPFALRLAELNKTPQRIQENIKLFSTLPVKVRPAYVMHLQSSYLDIQNEYLPLMKAPIAIPGKSGSAKASTIQRGKGGNWSIQEAEVSDWEQRIQELWDEMRRLEAAPLFNPMPKPPSQPLGYGAHCLKSDAAYHQQEAEFLRQVNGEEYELLVKALTLSRDAYEDLGVFQVRLYYRIYYDVQSTLRFVNQRFQRKLSLLVNTYGDDPAVAYCLLHTIYAIESEQYRVLPGLPFNQAFAHKLCETLVKAIDKALKERYYVIALDVHTFLSVQRYCKLVGFEIPDHYALWERFFKFNQFRMDMNVAAKAQAEGGYIESELKGKGWFMAVPNNEKCRLDWVFIGPQQSFVDMDVVKNNAVMKVPVPYMGGKIFHTGIPAIKVDFYSEKVFNEDNWEDSAEELFWSDSIIIHPFAEKNDNERWQFPAPAGVQKAALTNSVILGCFVDIERAKRQRAEAPELKKRAEQMKEELLKEYMPMIQKYQAQQGTRQPISPEEFKKLHDLQQKTTKMMQVTDDLAGNYIFYPESVATKNDAVILEETIYGKDLCPNPATVYAWFKLKIEHDPNAPYNKFYIGK
jgi:hypothetical protein